jgi:hypothetical protein
LNFRDICHPEEFEHSVAKEEATAGCALSWMLARRSLHEAGLPQSVGSGCTNGRVNENMIDDGRHLNYLGITGLEDH